MKQHVLIKQMSKRELRFQLFFSQGFILLLTIILSFLFFDSFFEWFLLFEWDISEILIYGGLSGVLIVVIELVLIRITPKRYWDDGGINEAVFRDQPISFIFVFTFVVAICEELLFRGVIQTTFGYIVASIIFAVVHVRYLKKPLLLFIVLFISFYLGWLYQYTGNLFVPIIMHFFVDFILGLVIRLKK
ncbi:CPBP family intramembrane glutamic endopeptidase [Oceanobacillus sp. J11TS1]|uniref:CPBP family intramembrane glutamic endopeptidase n=1 Tax=Oceanobacillus sp. J11TS1 TaxID=2807191 RepID=UPI001B0ECBA9|nr:type II CAAX endopeptidase family protein [Oceanobacillus sp. J11TS1]GIO22597.1 CAAX amino protease [Oceanobacillus sp. J11TS1]